VSKEAFPVPKGACEVRGILAVQLQAAQDPDARPVVSSPNALATPRAGQGRKEI